MSENYQAITNWVTMYYDPQSAQFNRQYPVWLHHKGASMVKAWKMTLIHDAALEAGQQADYSKLSSMSLALYHIRKSRFLLEAETIEEQGVEDGDTFILVRGIDPAPSIDDLMSYISMQKYPMVVGDEVPEGIKSISWKEISEYKVKKMERERAAAGSITAGSHSVIINQSSGFNRAVIGSAIGRIKTERGDEAAAIMAKINNHIAEQKNPAADVLWESLGKKINDDASEPGVIKAMWNGLLSILPTVGKVAEAAGGIAKVFDFGV